MKTRNNMPHCISATIKKKMLGVLTVLVGMVLTVSVLSSCEPKETFAEENTVLPPVTPQEIVRVAPDDGVVRINSLTKAIAANGDAVYELERGGIYYLEGKNVINKNVIIRAAKGTGELPTIQPLSDEQGQLNADMLRFEANVTFKNIYFNGKDAASNNMMQRLFRTDKANLRITFDSCFVENCRNFCIRTDAKEGKFYIKNSTFRNLALTSDPANGRLFDSRGNQQDTISIVNSTIYNMTGHLIRFDNAIMNYFEFKNNTVYNVGFHFQINYAMTAVIENNIIANMGWKAATKASSAVFWDVSEFTADGVHRPEDMRITIRNNNLFTVDAIKALYTKYPNNFERQPLNATGQNLITKGLLVYTNNISEVLTFDNAPALPMTYIEKYFEVGSKGMSKFADLPFYVDENGIDGFTNGQTFTFRYPSTAQSATASTTGSRLGSSMWSN